MNELQSDSLVLEAIFPNLNYPNKVTNKKLVRKYQWRDVEMLKEKMKLKKELLELSHYV